MTQNTSNRFDLELYCAHVFNLCNEHHKIDRISITEINAIESWVKFLKSTREEDARFKGIATHQIDCIISSVRLNGGIESKDALTIQFYLNKIDALIDREAIINEKTKPPKAKKMEIKQEPKYCIQGEQIVNRASGEAIPHDEPVFIFRARDKLAQAALHAYAMRCTGQHATAVLERAASFAQFALDHPERMKMPDTLPTPLVAPVP